MKAILIKFIYTMKAHNSPSNCNSESPKCTQKIDKGRWRAEEHELFLQGIKLFGRDWKKIESLVGTRSSPQIRSHAQKYFNKVNKGKDARENSSESSLMNKDSSSSLSSLLDLKLNRKKEKQHKIQKCQLEK